MKIARILFVARGFASASACAEEGTKWPDLPASFISGRSATPQDVKSGNAVFSMADRSEGPLNVKIPQYAFWKDDQDINHPVILVQAEKAPDGTEIVGLLNSDGTNTVATLPELTLLGIAKPN